MGNEHNLAEIASKFIFSTDAPELFGRLDFQLKDGVHFSQVEGQYDYYRFIEENEASLGAFYRRFFGLLLNTGGEGKDKYYYLEFNGQNRGPVDADHRMFLKNEYVLIGFLLYKVIFIDRNIELSSVREFQQTIRRDYEDLRPNLYRLLAKTKRENALHFNDDRFDDLVLDAFKEFNKIGWLTLDANNDEFDICPAFHRLNKVYSDYINDIDTLINKMSAE